MREKQITKIIYKIKWKPQKKMPVSILPNLILLGTHDNNIPNLIK